MTHANATKYISLRHPQASLLMTAQEYVNQSPDLSDFLDKVEFVCAKHGFLTGYHIFDCLVDFSIEDDRHFRDALVGEMIVAYQEYIGANTRNAWHIGNMWVDLLVQKYKENKTLPRLNWDALSNAIQAFMADHCSEATGFYLMPDEYPAQEGLDCP